MSNKVTAENFFEGSEDPTNESVTADNFFNVPMDPPTTAEDLSPEQLISLANPASTIDDFPIADFPSEDQRDLRDLALPEDDRSLAQNLVGSGIRGVLGPVASFLFPSSARQPATSKTEAFQTGVSRGASAFFQDEMTAAIDTLSDVVTGNLENFTTGGVVDRYRSHRDAARLATEDSRRKYPLLSFFGELAGGAALPGPKFLRGAKLIKRLATSGKSALLYGPLFGSGISNADLTRGEVGPFLKDTAVVTGLSLLFAVGAEATFGAIAKGGRRLFTQGEGGKQGAAAVLAGGQGAKRVPDRIFEQIPFEAQNAASKSITKAQKFGLVDLHDFGISIPTSTKKSGAFKKGWTSFKEFFFKGDDIDFNVARERTIETTRALGDQLDDIYSRAQTKLGKASSLKEVFGSRSESELLRIQRNLALGDDASRSAAQSLDDAINLAKSGSVDIQTKNRILQFLGDAAGFTSGKQPRIGSSTDKARQMYFKLRKNINEDIRKALPEEFNDYSRVLDDLSDLTFFDHMLRMGAKAKGGSEAHSQGFFSSTITDEVQALPGAGSQFLGGLSLGTASGFGKLIGSTVVAPLRIGSTLAASGLQNPVWAARVFNSLANNKIRSVSDKELAKHYIDHNGKLTEKEKATQIQKLNSDGTYDFSNIPEDIQKKARER